MNLDRYQREAVENKEEKVLLIAPPGSGKTTVLIEKIIWLIKEKKIRGERILVLTFSKSASENIKERVKKRDIRGPHFSTIHSLAYSYLMDREKKIITDRDLLYLINGLLRKYGLGYEEGLRALSLLLEEKERMKGDLGLNRNQGEASKTIKDISYSKDFLKELDKEYSKAKGDKFKDFSDLMIEFIDYLDGKEGEGVKSSYDYILVDEFQDLNPIQIKIIKKLSERANLFCVGDEDQCIYSFRGASSYPMVEFSKIFKGGKKLYLKFNYRSRLSIIDLANDVILNNKLRNEKKIETNSNKKGRVEIHRVEDTEEGIVKALKLINASNPYSNFALLFRTNYEMFPYIEAFIKRGLRFSLLDKTFNPFNRPFYKEIFSFINCQEDPKGFIRCLNTCLPGKLKRQSLFCLNELNEITREKIIKNIKDGVDRKRILGFYDEVSNLIYLKPQVILDRIFYILNYGLSLKERINRSLAKGSSTYKRGIYSYLEDLEDLKESFKSFKDGFEMLAFLKAYGEITMEANDKMERIVLGTMHSVKGMEFDSVLLVNLCEEMIPHGKSIKDLEGERRLFYVAITRAKDHLYLMVPSIINNKEMEESIFLKELGDLSRHFNSFGKNQGDRK